MNDTTRAQRVKTAADNGVRLANGMDALIASIRGSAAGQPGAQSYEAVRSGPRNVVFCEMHHQDLTDCERKRRDGELEGECSSVPVLTVTDPTGDAGSRHDRARADEKRLDDLIDRWWNCTEQIIDLAQTYRKRKPTPKDLRESDQIESGCRSCRKIPGPRTPHWWNPPRGMSPTDVNGTLPAKLLLCDACYAFVRQNGREPNEAELTHKRDKGRWPKRHDKASA